MSNDRAIISAGTAFDSSGRRIVLLADENVDFERNKQAFSAKYKWVTLLIEHAVRENGKYVVKHDYTSVRYWEKATGNQRKLELGESPDSTLTTALPKAGS